MSKPRRILSRISFTSGGMPGPSVYVRWRLVPCPPHPGWTKLGHEWLRHTSSIDAMVNFRAGLKRDLKPVEPRDGDILPTWPNRKPRT